MESEELFEGYFWNELNMNDKKSNIHIITIIPATNGKCLQMFYLSNKKFAVTKYRVLPDLFFSR